MLNEAKKPAGGENKVCFNIIFFGKKTFEIADNERAFVLTLIRPYRHLDSTLLRTKRKKVVSIFGTGCLA